ncbi:hypothetical protein PsYK624_004830 [Phanerochaete sordida]|uniref:F-box domain-containing protein n=1 Tax=Phanerochaete sordida TaxID=48140 RepID=A0A9P3FXP3_9APHY|nr:hypothetical protein PsYK624_004830 [Phanerochaete sordida]
MDRRWPYFSGDTLTPPSYYNLALHGFSEAIRLPLLTYLHVDCKDTEALSSAFRRISFPSLEHLVLSYSGRASTAPTLPPASRLFRDPRLVNLAYLEIRHFTLDAETLATLAYMPSLTTLSLYACPGTNAMICALSGYACKHEGSEPPPALPVKWLCPNLRELRLTHSATKFWCLETAVRTRKKGVVAAPAPSTPPRRIRPLKKSALVLGASASTTPQKTPRKVAMQEICASPNGSFVDGWRAHEATRPSPIRTIHVLGCKNISQVELWSLRFDQYGVESVSWCE